MNCPLCKSQESTELIPGFYDCKTCRGIFRSKEAYINSTEEKQRYESHNNDVEDQGYQDFTSPITNAVLKNFKPDHKGLDFGAGPGPVISKVLEDNNYDIVQYDPFFHNNPELLEQAYDYIVCCEVIEHFHNPAKEFELLKTLLNPNGKLYCMTHLYDESIDFKDWYYKNDPTHVFFYRVQTIEWITIEYGFKSPDIENRLIVLSK